MTQLLPKTLFLRAKIIKLFKKTQKKGQREILPPLKSSTFVFFIGNLFQFQQVQLKESTKKGTKVTRFISIPIGSIKSQSQLEQKQYDNISIPIGSIKSSIDFVNNRML